MDESQDKKLNSIVSAPSLGIVQTGLDSLARRGLQELAISARWTRKQVFSECPRVVSVSPTGLIATDWKRRIEETYSIAIHNPESEQSSVIESKGYDGVGPLKDWAHIYPDYFAWSPCGKYLLSLSGEFHRPVRIYDAARCQFLAVVDYFDAACKSLVWSPKANHLATTTNARWPSLSVWDVQHKQSDQGSYVKIVENRLDAEWWLSENEEFISQHSETGCTMEVPQLIGDFAFSPDETLLAVSAANWLEYPSEKRLEDEEGDIVGEELGLEIFSVVAFEVANLRQRFRVEVPHAVTSISWGYNGRLIVCCSGEVYGIDPNTAQISRLPIKAELCRCHPVQDICAFGGQQWPMSHHRSDDRLFVVSLSDQRTIAEQADIGGTRDIAWGVDGKTLYAVSGKGDFWVCSIP